MRTGLWFVVLDIFEPEVGYEYPVVRHVFPGKTEEEARGYYDAHMTTDVFMRDCVNKGQWESLKCVPSMVVLPPLVPIGSPSPRMDPCDFDPIALHEGVVYELRESTTDSQQARLSAMVHLTQDPGYYVKMR